MHLYHLTLQRPTAITSLAYGSFTGPRTNEFVCVRGSALELIRVDDATGRLVSLKTTDTFGVVRAVLPLRVLGRSTDYAVVSSDSGRITILEWAAAGGGDATGAWSAVASETFGKAGVRRGVPGQFLARDPAGRAVLIGAPEKGKFVYTISRDATNALVVSSPLEAHRSHMLTFDIVGLDVGFENPAFACLEVDTAEADGRDAPPPPDAAARASKVVAIYELDLGANTVVRKWARETDRGANSLLALPGTAEAPGGVLVFAENWVLYESPLAGAALRTPIPRRIDQPDERGVIIVASTLHKTKAGFFVLAQAERGDLYRIEIIMSGSVATDLIVRYFDSIAPTSALAITRSGLLFAASDSGNHALYQFVGLGDSVSPSTPQAAALKIANAEGTVEVHVPVFAPRVLKNLLRLDESLGLHTLSDAHVVPAKGGRGAPTIAALCGRASRSTLRLLSEGLAVTENAVSPLPAAPLRVFTLKSAAAKESDVGSGGGAGGTDASVNPDTRIVLSFTNATIVLGVGETVEELPADSTGFDAAQPTLATTLLPDGSYIQVHPTSMRMIGPGVGGAKGTVRAWTPPGKKRIVAAAANARQILLALSGGDLKVFEYDAASRAPVERGSKSLGAEVLAVTLPAIDHGRLRAPLCIVADANNLVRVLWLNPDRPLEQAASQALRSPAESVALLPSLPNAPTAYMLYVGLANGVLTRLSLDAGSGALSDARVRFLGGRAVRLVPVRAGGAAALIVLCTRAWVAHMIGGGRVMLSPLCYEPLEAVAPFSTDALPEALVAVVGASLRVLTLEHLGAGGFTANTLALARTPRRIAAHESSGCSVIVCADHDALGAAAAAAARAAAEAAHPIEVAAALADAAPTDPSDSGAAQVESETDATARVGDIPPIAVGGFSGTPSWQAGRWASNVRLVNLSELARSGGSSADSRSPLHCTVELENDEAALCVATVRFHDSPTDELVVVGTATGMTLHPRRARSTSLRTYRVVAGDDGGEAAMEDDLGAVGGEGSAPSTRWRLELEHVTVIEGASIPGALIAFGGRLLVGVGDTLRLFDRGKKQLLRKCELRGLPSFVTCLAASLDRVFVGDAAESVFVIRYRRAENIFIVFADDTATRWTTALTVLDHDTVAVGDRFGTLAVLRVPPGANDDAGDGPSSQSSAFHNAPHKLVSVSQFFAGGAITSLSRGMLADGAMEVLIYSTSSGGIGALAPLANKDDVGFFTHLEMYMRTSAGVSLIGRDNLSFRSYFAPIMNVIDGDLCESFATQPLAQQRTLAEDLSRPVAEVAKKVEDLRAKIQ